MNWLSTILSTGIGVVTGIAANLLTYLFVTVWLPMYRNYVYRGIRVSGEWTVNQKELAEDGEGFSVAWSLCISLDQKAYTVSGQATAIRLIEETTGAADVLNYEVEGHIYDRFVALTLRNTDNARFAYSTFMLEVKGDGSRMIGYRSFYGIRKEAIRCVECTLRRGTPEAARCRSETRVPLLKEPSNKSAVLPQNTTPASDNNKPHQFPAGPN